MVDCVIAFLTIASKHAFVTVRSVHRFFDVCLTDAHMKPRSYPSHAAGRCCVKPDRNGPDLQYVCKHSESDQCDQARADVSHALRAV